jgi:photosystem II stability/assembly factor-like uncharacterized protein
MKRTYLILFALVLFCNTKSQDWQWKNPLPTGNYLNRVQFSDSTTAYAVGNYGTILKSTNRGLDWKVQKSGTILDLNSLSIIDNDTIYVCSKNLNVFKTTNGGKTWVNVFNKSISSNESAIFFASPAVGYLAGDGTTLYKTINYGKTWMEISAGYDFQNISSMYFTSDNVGYATVGYGSPYRTLKTINGGLSWTASNNPIGANESSNAITFINDSIGYQVGDMGLILLDNSR